MHMAACVIVAASATAQPMTPASSPLLRAAPIVVDPVRSSIGTPGALAPLAMDWSTIDAGGGPATNGLLALKGTVGQPDPAVMNAGSFEMTGGYWFGQPPAPPACYPDCDHDNVLSVDDFICFQTLFAVQDPTADCDQDLALSIDDFICFQTLYAIGC
jgi:hypothetical protein